MKKISLIFALATALLFSCMHVGDDAPKTSNDKIMKNEQNATWQEQLSERMPYLGHRNWIVITDMAYPMQSGSGIITLYADEPYEKVLAQVKNEIDKASHVFAHVYRDKELTFLTDADVPGIENLKKEMSRICGDSVVSKPHEELIKSLDEAGTLYQVVIIKTPLAMPYTTTFFQLDCKYWNAAKQAKLDKAMGK